MREIRQHVPQAVFTKHELVDKGDALGIVLTGHMSDLPRPGSDFEIVHIDGARGRCASLDGSDSSVGRETLGRLHTYYGRRPRLVHTGQGMLGHEYWSDQMHEEMAAKWEHLIANFGRRIIKKNY